MGHHTTTATRHYWDYVIDLLAAELHVSKSEISDEDELSELGVDAILGCSIISKISQHLGINLPANVFQTHSNVGKLCAYISEQVHLCQSREVPKLVEKRSPQAKTIVISTVTEMQMRPPTTPKKPALKKKSIMPLSMVLQGNPTAASQTIFLLPDGSGSGMAYTSIPSMPPTTCLIGLNSPYLNRPHDYNCTIEQVATEWVPEIRARQPHGPYILGGWSAGGYYSYEVTKLLLAQGESVSKLILLDSPCRTDFEALPMEVVRYMGKTGRMGNWGSGGRTPEWVTAHFEATLRAVRAYMPTPLRVPVGLQAPQVFIVWCRDGVWTTHPDNDPKRGGLNLNVRITRFLLEDKPGFGAHCWDKLFPGMDLSVATMPGNHFTLLSPPYVDTLGVLLKDVVMERKGNREGVWKRVGK